MRILTYRDLEWKSDLLPLLDNSFGWPFNPRTYEKLVKIDSRLRNSPIGFCALEDGRAVGFVGVMDLATRTLKTNIEYVGGIYGVATLPNYARRGVSTALMNRAHQHFKDKGYAFSFLCTNRTLVAYAMYQKLGYTDLLERPSAYKVLEPKKAKSSEKKKTPKVDFDRLLKVYNECVKDKTGFVVRDKAYLTMLKKTVGFSDKECIIAENGYAIFKSNFGGVWSKATWIRELVASNRKEINALLDLVEAQASDLILDRVVLDQDLLQTYRSRDYMIQNRSHVVIMVKPLTANASFKRIYGDKFYLTDLNLF